MHMLHKKGFCPAPPVVYGKLISSGACRYHLGSIALGSFIIAVIQFIRAVLEYVDRQMKTANPGNVVLKYLMACAK